MKPIVLLITVMLAGHAGAQLFSPGTGVRGKFHVSVDDRASILINGTLVHEAPMDESVSAEVALKPGDRVVARLANTEGYHRFMLLFVATDGKSMVSFDARSLKVLPDPEAKDFNLTQFSSLRSFAVVDTREWGEKLPIKGKSQWVWGDQNQCALGAVITREMFKPAAIRAVADALPSGEDATVALTVQAAIDGGSTLHIRKDSLYWENGPSGKPSNPTYVAGKPWVPLWGKPNEQRGQDKTDPYPISLPTLDLKTELVQCSSERANETIDKTRTPIEVKRRASEITIHFPDPEAGGRWYKVVLRSRKK